LVYETLYKAFYLTISFIKAKQEQKQDDNLDSATKLHQKENSPINIFLFIESIRRKRGKHDQRFLLVLIR
jgi:hypothetical protein